MEKYLIFAAIIFVVMFAVIRYNRNTLTDEEEQFVLFVQKLAKNNNVTKKDMPKHVDDNFVKLQLMYSLHFKTTPLIGDSSRVIRAICDTY